MSKNKEKIKLLNMFYISFLGSWLWYFYELQCSVDLPPLKTYIKHAIQYCA